jgi:hypothetical protein
MLLSERAVIPRFTEVLPVESPNPWLDTWLGSVRDEVVSVRVTLTALESESFLALSERGLLLKLRFALSALPDGRTVIGGVGTRVGGLIVMGDCSCGTPVLMLLL